MNEEINKLSYNENYAITLTRNIAEATPLRYDMIDEIAGDRLELRLNDRRETRRLITSKHGDTNLWKFGIRKGKLTYWIQFGKIKSLIQEAVV